MDFLKEKEKVAYFMRRLYSKNLTTTSGGNISLRVDENQVLVTASQTDKGRMSSDDVGLVSLDGESITTNFRASMETAMHLAVFRDRKDVHAIVHAHPTFATAFAITNKTVNCKLMGEAWAVCGEAAFANYRLMGTSDLAETVAQAAQAANIVLMENHGVLAVGTSLLEAFDRLEVFETSAKLTFITEIIGNRKELSSDQLRQIDALFD